MEYDELELDTLGDQKTALFVILSDTDSTFNFVAALMYSQLLCWADLGIFFAFLSFFFCMTISFFSAAERASPYTLPFFTVFLGVSAFLVLIVNLQFLLFLDFSLNGSVKIVCAVGAHLVPQ